MPLRAHARVSYYYDDRKCHFGKPQIFECPALATSALTRALGNFPLPYNEADDYQAPVACRWHVSKWPIATFAAVAQGRSVSEEKRTSPTVYEYTA